MVYFDYTGYFGLKNLPMDTESKRLQQYLNVVLVFNRVLLMIK